MIKTIGNTPAVCLKRIVPPDAAEVWVKIEGVNPTGSYKDRMALAMVEGAETEGVLDKKLRLLECTGGSTGTSLAFVCAVKGYPFTIITSDAYAREKIDSMRAFGAEVIVEPSKGGRVTPDLWPRMRQRAEDLVGAVDLGLALDDLLVGHFALRWRFVCSIIADPSSLVHRRRPR